MPLSSDDLLGTGSLSPMLILLVGLVVLFAAVAIMRNFARISCWFCEDPKRLLAAQIASLTFGVFGFAMLWRAGTIGTWSFDRAALLIGGLTVIAGGRIAADRLGRKRRQIRRQKTGEDEAGRRS